MNGTLTFPPSAESLNPFPTTPFGFERGILTEADSVPRVTQTADGLDLNGVWLEHAAVLNDWNSRSANLAALVSYWHFSAADAIPKGFYRNQFELASEMGEPVGIRPGGYELVGYRLDDYDVALRYSWRALREMDSRQVRGVFNDALAADNRLVVSKILDRLFDPTPGENEQGTPTLGLYSADGMEPAPFAGQTFEGTHTHYLVSGNTELDSGDVEGALKHVREHGFGVAESGQQLLLLCHPSDAETVMSWRAGQENANSAVAKYDALPSVGAPAFEIPGQIVGQQAPAELFGVPIIGSYGPALVVESFHVPHHYVAVVATAGPNSLSNPIGVREHALPAYRGLRQIGGNVPGYPLQDSFLTRAFGVGTRHRGAAAVCQITDSGSYTAPTITV